MYSVLVVDDEPGSVQYIRKIIEKKCPDFEVAGQAENGLDALEWLKENRADVVVADVRMPVMNGVELVTFIHENWPEIISVIVSGYQDFEYLQGAIRAGVCDYLVKPVNPSEMAGLFRKLKGRLDRQYYTLRNQILHRLSRDTDTVDSREVKKFFPAGQYHAAILRKGSVISRFAVSTDRELYSVQGEQIIIYGRDTAEMLFFYPDEMIMQDFSSMMRHQFFKMNSNETWQTMVVKSEAFPPEEMGEVMQQLFHRLDDSIVIGKPQILSLGKGGEREDGEEAREVFAGALVSIRRRDAGGFLKQFRRLFQVWEEESFPQVKVERKVRLLLDEMEDRQMMEDYQEYLLEDCYADARSMEELEESLEDYISQNLIRGKTGRGQNKEELFREITNYMSRNIADDLSVKAICRHFGISQTSLNRIFHSYADTSYSSYLTELRIRIARRLLEENPDLYIKDVAADVGYTDQFYFSRIFRSVTGVSPTEFVKSLSGMEE